MINRGLIENLLANPDTLEFTQVINFIEQHYSYTPTRFVNGDVINEAGKNEGSCKVFYFAKINLLSEMETLSLFAQYYRDDVLGNPGGDDHANIRTFILEGWAGVKFNGVALTEKVVH